MEQPNYFLFLPALEVSGSGASTYQIPTGGHWAIAACQNRLRRSRRQMLADVLPGTGAGRRMNARKRALLKYGFYGAGALVCAALAALGSFRVFPLVTGPGRPVF